MPKIPKYRQHDPKGRNKGFVEYKGRKTYFTGKFNSPESLKEYSDFVRSLAESYTADTVPADPIPKDGTATVAVLVVKFLDWAKTNYVKKDGRSTGTYEKFRDSIAPPLLDLFGNTPTSQFGPLTLKQVREKYVEAGLCRNEVNDRTARIKRIFNWGVENEILPPAVADALKYVAALREGKTSARETAPIKPVADEIIAATIPFLPPTVDDMVRIQRLTGCRPSEVCNLRWCDINQSDDVWIFTPWEWKTEHHNTARHVAIIPAAREHLEKYRHRPAEAYVFSPRETVRIIAERKRAARKTPLTPSQVKRGEAAAEKTPKHNERYSTRAYELAIDRAVDKHNRTESRRAEKENREPALLPHWSPNQLRHAFATEARDQHDVETAQMLMGHTSLNTTEIYAEKSMRKIKEAARKIDEKKRERIESEIAVVMTDR